MAASQAEGGMARLARWVVVATIAAFGLVTVNLNGLLPLLATAEARAELGAIPYPVFWFLFLMGWAYLAAAWGLGRRRRWALELSWTLAVLHALSATVLWLMFFAGSPVEQGLRIMELVREGFWVCIGLYLWQARAQGHA